ncbi:MAG: 50S ribosomal protein L21 [Patescibacteria group bacterium]|jgi:large subunit ribosomal protein L21
MEATENFAIIKTGGKQYKVKVGDVLKVEKLTLDESSKENELKFDDILGGKVVTATRVLDGRLPKVRILKFRPKKRYKKVTGHRQSFSQIKIEKIA